MAKYEVTAYDPDGNEIEYLVEADDEAAALGHVLDEHGDEISDGSPFAVCKKAAPRRRVRGKRKPKRRSKKPLTVSEETAAPIHPAMRELLEEVSGVSAQKEA